jgi:hypothetical protein
VAAKSSSPFSNSSSYSGLRGIVGKPELARF